MSQVDHRRLIRTLDMEITHHVAHNGDVHDGHPRGCGSPRCRQWGDELMSQGVTIHEARRHPVYAWIGIFLTLLMLAIVAGIIIVTIRNL